jgi:hypothetical protein
VSTYDYTQTRNDIITRALRILGVVAQGETPTSTQITEAAQALNGLVLAWQADGMPLWVIKKYSFSLVEGQKEYIFADGITSPGIDLPKPLKLYQAWYHNNTSNVDVPLRIVTEQQYNMLGNKDVEGLPVQIWYKPEKQSGTLTVYQVPDAWTAANIVLSFIYQAPFYTFDAANDVPDFPPEWYDAITYGLATRLAPEYGLPTGDRKVLLQEMLEIKQTALNFGLEEGSLYFQIERYGW